MGTRIGIDIGGTFTDFTVLNEDGSTFLWKEDSTPDEPTSAIDQGLSAVSKALGTRVEDLMNETDLLVHGTTVATNTLIQRNGPRIGLLCTKGFRDVLYFRDGYKPRRFDVHNAHPRDFVDRWLRIGIPERMNHRGEELISLNEQSVRDAARLYRDADVEAVAIAFLWSMMNPDHEEQAASILREVLPNVKVVCSHIVLPEIREWQRTSSTVLSAYVLPGISDYLQRFEEGLSEKHFQYPPLIMQINGGCARVDDILARPVSILASGPAAAPAAALHYAQSIGNDLITVDMGGTSLDVCVIGDGRPTMSREIQVEDQPIGIPAVECHSIGAGGGSIAWIDPGDALRVGPRSAGARPGPAAYGLGGLEPTVTDANVVLGYLQPQAFLGGRRELQGELSKGAIETHIAEPLDLSVSEAAAGIRRVVNANMVAAIRVMSVERGIDPRRFTLVCGGGAGGLHAAALARELGIERVFVPSEAGTFCAFGMTVTDVRHDYSSAVHVLTDEASVDPVNRALARMESEARARLSEEGFREEAVSILRSVDARYPSQVHEITVDFDVDGDIDNDGFAAIALAFHEAHERLFAYGRPNLPVECLHWRVTAVGRHRASPVELRHFTTKAAQPWGAAMCFEANGSEYVETPTYSVTELDPGDFIEGPAIVQAPTTTVVVPGGDRLNVTADDNFIIEVWQSHDGRATSQV